MPRPSDPNDAKDKREHGPADNADRPTRGSQKEMNDIGYPPADPHADDDDENKSGDDAAD